MSALRYIAFKHYSIDGCVTVEQEEAVLDLVLRAEAGRCLPRVAGTLSPYNASAVIRRDARDPGRRRAA